MYLLLFILLNHNVDILAPFVKLSTATTIILRGFMKTENFFHETSTWSSEALWLKTEAQPHSDTAPCNSISVVREPGVDKMFRYSVYNPKWLKFVCTAVNNLVIQVCKLPDKRLLHGGKRGSCKMIIAELLLRQGGREEGKSFKILTANCVTVSFFF